MAREARQFRLERVPLHVRLQHARPEQPPEHLFPMTPQQVADASGLGVDLIRRRLTQQRIRDWPKLTRSASAARESNIRTHRRRMAAERFVDVEDAAREHTHQERVRLGNRKL